MYSGANLTQVTFSNTDPTPLGSTTVAGLWEGATDAEVAAQTPGKVLTTDNLDAILDEVPRQLCPSVTYVP